MLIIPAIDLKDGCVVRLVQGKYAQKVYSRDPVKAARHWAKQGAKLIHVVDLDGAFTGKPKNLKVIKEIAADVSVPIEVGGGARTIQAIKSLLDAGVKRVVLGTKAVTDEAFLKRAFANFKNKIIVGVDLKNEAIVIRGWKSVGKRVKPADFVRGLKEMGFKEAIYTDTLKDGTLKGPNIKGIKALLKEVKIGVIASGGVSSLADISRLKLLEKQGVTGVIVGKALYEGRFTLPQAMKIGLSPTPPRRCMQPQQKQGVTKQMISFVTL